MIEGEKKQKEFCFVFEEEEETSLSYEVSTDGKERLTLCEHEGQKFFYGNKEGLLVLAKICVKLALGNYPNGHHLHLNENFDEESGEIMAIGIEPDRND